MATILRVKRRKSIESQDALLIACKKRKITESEEDVTFLTPVTAVIKFAGTVKNQDENVVDHITKTLSKEELKANFKQHIVDITSKMRQKAKETSAENRYKVISSFRSLGKAKSENLIDNVTTVIDIEDSASKTTSDKDDNYVYDLYYTETQDDMLLDQLVSVHPLHQELVFDRKNDSDEENACESEDSNCESNWRNDYPDSDHSENSIDDDDMRYAMQTMKLNDENSDLSSEEDFAYGLDADDVERYGHKYARYKAKIGKELDDDEYEDEDSESENSSENENFDY